jgi:hypothetical protein
MPRLIDKHIIVARAADLPQKQSWNSPAAAPATAQPNMQEERGLMARQEVYHKFRHAVPINCTTAVEEEILGVALKSLPPGLQLRHFVVWFNSMVLRSHIYVPAVPEDKNTVELALTDKKTVQTFDLWKGGARRSEDRKLFIDGIPAHDSTLTCTWEHFSSNGLLLPDKSEFKPLAVSRRGNL